RRAETVESQARHGDREPGEEGRHPGDVPVVLSRLVRTAEIHFVHEGGVHARASHDLANDERPEVIGPDVLERALVSAHRGPHSAHDHRFRHSGIPRIAPSHGPSERITTSVAWTSSPPAPISCAGWPSPTGRRSRNSRGGGPGSKASLRRLIPPLRGTFSPRLPGPLPPSFVVGNVYPPSSV